MIMSYKLSITRLGGGIIFCQLQKPFFYNYLNVKREAKQQEVDPYFTNFCNDLAY